MRPSVRIFISALVLDLVALPLAAQQNSDRFWSLATAAITTPSGEQLYKDYKDFQEFERNLMRMPWDDFEDQNLAPWETPEETIEALSETAGLMDYIEARTAQDLGVFKDALIGSHARGYASGSRDSDRATIATEITAANIRVIGAAYRGPHYVVDEFISRVETAGKIWASGAIRDNVLAPETLRRYSAELDNSSVEALEEAQKIQLEKGSRFLQSLFQVEGLAAQSAAAEANKENQSALSLVADISAANGPSDLQKIAQKLEAGEYPGSVEEQDDYKSLVESATEFVASSSEVTKKANEVAELLDAANIDLPEPASKALGFANAFNSTSSQLISGNYIGAATGALKFFGPKTMSGEQLRHKAIMDALNRIDRKLDRVLDNQALLLEGQAKIMQQLDRMEWTMQAGFQNIEVSLQESTEIILRAVFAADDRALAVCSAVANSIDPILYPESAESIDLIRQPNGSGLADRLRLSWLENPPDISVKLEYISERYGLDLSRCNIALSDLFNALQGGRKIDEYFSLNRIFSGEAPDTESIRSFAKSYRDELFHPIVINYYLPRMADLLVTKQGLTIENAQKAAVALAFSPPRFTETASVEGNFDISFPSTARSRLAVDHEQNRVTFEKYFTEAIYEELSRPLSAPSVLYAAKAVGDLHSVFGLMGRDPSRFSVETLNPDKQHPAQNEEDALRLLMQALQIVEILRAQQAIIDGTSLVELLWNDLHSRETEKWDQAGKVIDASALIRNNFTRYALYRAVTNNESNSPFIYRAIVASGNRKQLESFLDNAMGDAINVTLECGGVETEEEKLATFCESTMGNRYATKFRLKLQWPDADPNAKPLLMASLPGFLVLESRHYLRSDSAQTTQLVHDHLRTEVASYQFGQALEEALVSEDVADLVPRIRTVYQLSQNLKRGYQRPSASE